jgi:hypothetical protein
VAITKALRSDKGAEFIAAAPDVKPERWQRGNKTQITLSISPRLLERVDEVARRKEVSRAALLTFWIGDALDREAA